ncbi:MAG: bifunctional DNA-formamidopyrimidine glycosylase/DNA-(apurinic or apyrimidinic site) lyase [Pseudomonadota bacterium]
MPELPEVETTRRGIAPHVEGGTLQEVVVRESRLRWPVPPSLPAASAGQPLEGLERRAKYLIFRLPRGNLLLHLGMSGSVRVIERGKEPALKPHDHVDLCFDRATLRLNDPRRFGSLLWSPHPVSSHPLLAELGPEPLGDAFDGDYLFERSRGRRGAVKNFLMDGHVVVGVGNIYASESLFEAGISPTRPAGRISRARYVRLAQTVRKVLQRAIDSGGSTLRDFLRSDGSPGYFQLELAVYGREGEPCRTCGTEIRQRVIGQRASYYCLQCQR